MAPFAGKRVTEAAAPAMEPTVAARPLGSFGKAGVFSLSKHPGAGSGGVLTVESLDDLRALERARDELLQPSVLRDELVGVAVAMARETALRLNLVRPALRLMRSLGMEEEREGFRIALRAENLEKIIESAPELPPFDSWVQADMRNYRTARGSVARWYQSRRVARLSRDTARRVAGVRLLSGLPSVAPAVHDHLDQPLFRVPLLVRDREAAIVALERNGVTTGYMYDPPYDEYAPGYTEPSPDPEPARWWASHVLPIDPL